MFTFRVLDVSRAPVLPTNGSQAVVGTVSPADSENAYFVIHGNAGQTIRFEDAGSTPDGGLWTLYNAQQYFSPVRHAVFGHEMAYLLPSTGDYILEGSPWGQNPVAYGIVASVVSDVSETVNLGETLAGKGQPGATSTFRFAASRNQQVYFDNLGVSSLAVTLRGPDGAVVSPYGELAPSAGHLVPYDQGPYILREDGLYTLAIRPGVAEQSPEYAFRLLDATESPELILDGPTVSGTLDRALQATISTFQGTEGQRVIFRDLAPESDGGGWRLYAPTGWSYWVGQEYGMILPTSGRYLLVRSGITSSGSVPYSLQAIIPPSTTSDYSLGRTESITIGPGERRSFTFEGAAGGVIFYDGLNANSSSMVSVRNPDGSILVYCGPDGGPLVLPATGTYTLTVQRDDFGQAETFAFRILDSATIPSVPVDGADVSGAFDSGLHTTLYAFQGIGGQRVGFQYQASAPDSGTWSVYGPVGTDNPMQTEPANLLRDFNVTLPATGRYLLILTGGGLAEPVSFSLVARIDQAVVVREYQIGETERVTIGSDEEDRFTFNAVAGQRIYYDDLNGSTAWCATLMGRSGDILFSADADAGPWILPTSGVYTLLVSSWQQPGDFTFRILNVAESPRLSIDGAAISGTLDPGLKTTLFAFPGSKFQRVEFRDQGSSIGGGTWSVYGPRGTRVPVNYDASTLGMDFGVTLPETGDYLLVLLGNDSQGVVSYSLQAVTSGTAKSNTYQIGQTESVTIAPGDEERFLFSVTAGQRIFYLNQSNNGLSASVELIDPSGSLVFSGGTGTGEQGPFTLAASGTCTFAVRNPSLYDAAEFTFRILDPEQAPPFSADGRALEGVLRPSFDECGLFLSR